MMMQATALGAHLVLTPRFDPEATLAEIEKRKATWVYLVPTMMTRIWRRRPRSATAMTSPRWRPSGTWRPPARRG